MKVHKRLQFISWWETQDHADGTAEHARLQKQMTSSPHFHPRSRKTKQYTEKVEPFSYLARSPDTALRLHHISIHKAKNKTKHWHSRTVLLSSPLSRHSSSVVGSLPSWSTMAACKRTTLQTWVCRFMGSRITLPQSAKPQWMPWCTHHVAYVLKRKPFFFF